MKKYKFSDIAYNITEKKMPVPEDKDTYIGLEHLDSGSLSINRYGSEVVLKGEKLVMKKGDILFGRRNAYLKRAAIAPHDGLFSAHGMIFRPKTEVVNERFFPFFIASDYFMDMAIRISVGSLSPTVNWGTLKDIEFSLPDLKEQERISEILWAADDTKEAYKILLSSTEDLIKSQFIEMFGDPVINEKGWNKRPLSDTCDIITGNTPPRVNAAYYGNYIEWIKSDNISQQRTTLSTAAEHLSEEGALVGRVVSSGSILMTCIAGGLNSIGNIAIVDRDIAFNQQINALVPKRYETWFLYYLLLMMRPSIHEATNKALKCILSKGQLSNVEAIVPPKPQQKQFALFAEQSDKSKLKLQQTIFSLENAVKSLVQQHIG